MRYTLSKSSDGQYYFEIQAGGNWETLATSETYVRKADADAAIKQIQNGAGGATVVDNT